MSKDVKAVVVASLDDMKERGGDAGVTFISKGPDKKPVELLFNCPCGCGRMQTIALGGKKLPSFFLDGTDENPTLIREYEGRERTLVKNDKGEKEPKFIPIKMASHDAAIQIEAVGDEERGPHGLHWRGSLQNGKFKSC